MMTTTTRSRRWRTTAAVLVVSGCVAFVVWGIARDIDEVPIERLVWRPLARASAVLLAAYVFRAFSFGVVVRTLDATAPLTRSARVFLAAQLGRYIPGKVWQVAGAGYVASRLGISATAGVVGTAYYVVIHNLVGALLGVWAVVQLFPEAPARGTGYVVLAIGVAVIALASSPVFPRTMAWLGRKLGRDLVFDAIPLWVVGFTVASSLFVWTLFGVAVTDVFAAVVPSEPPPPLSTAITNMAGASVAGLAVLVAPSGLGVREAVFVAAFSTRYSVAAAGVVALVLRILMSLLEVVLSIVSLAGSPKQHEVG